MASSSHSYVRAPSMSHGVYVTTCYIYMHTYMHTCIHTQGRVRVCMHPSCIQDVCIVLNEEDANRLRQYLHALCPMPYALRVRRAARDDVKKRDFREHERGAVWTYRPISSLTCAARQAYVAGSTNASTDFYPHPHSLNIQA